jgi:hypothetical protein
VIENESEYQRLLMIFKSLMQAEHLSAEEEVYLEQIAESLERYELEQGWQL